MRFLGWRGAAPTWVLFEENTVLLNQYIIKVKITIKQAAFEKLKRAAFERLKRAAFERLKRAAIERLKRATF